MGFLSKKPLLDQSLPREFDFGCGISPALHHNENEFINNQVFTAKYTLWTFLPKNMFEQLIGNLSPSGKYTTITPLSLVLIFSAVKEAFEDYKRHQSDKEVNHSKSFILKNGSFVSIDWRDIRVGNICRIRNNEQFPTDMILLASTSEQSVCYVETCNLDGETNLKVHQALGVTGKFNSIDSITTLSGSITCDAPNNKLYDFEGVLKLDGKEYKLGPKQQLLRGCILRNTEYIYGLSVYTGHDTKIVRNSSLPPTKFSRVDHMTNKANVIILIIMLIICLVSTFGNAISNYFVTDNQWYMYDHSHYPGEYIGMFFTFAILVNFLLPVSLYVTLEVVKYICGSFIENDLEMFDKTTGIAAKSICSNLVEELGQVDYVFSDKTGTLTQNVMLFKECTVAGKMYGSMSQPEIPQDNSNDRENVPKDSPDFYVDFPSNDFLNDLSPTSAISNHHKSLLDHFCWCLAVNHSVLALSDDVKPEDRVNSISYQASSPDENALVAAAHFLGYQFHNRGTSSVQVLHNNVNHQIEILNLIPFNSTRKRMSIFVRLRNKIIMYTKGADSVIYERLDPSTTLNPEVTKETTLEHLSSYARIGLRTLCLAYREIDSSEFTNWTNAFDTVDRDMSLTSSQRQDAKDDLSAQMEKNLILIGATAIEDKLQDEVADTLRSLSEAGIKTWVLTGDKMETAINIGFSSNLLTPDMDVMICYEHGSSLDHKEYPSPSGGGLSSGYREIVHNTLTKHLSEQRERLERMGLSDRSKPGWFQNKVEKMRQLKAWFDARQDQDYKEHKMAHSRATADYTLMYGQDVSEQGDSTFIKPLLNPIESDPHYNSPALTSDTKESLGTTSRHPSALQMAPVDTGSDANITLGSLGSDEAYDDSEPLNGARGKNRGRSGSKFNDPPLSPRSIRMLGSDGIARAPVGENPFAEFEMAEQEEASGQAPLSLVISGKALEYALEPDMQMTLLQLSMLCQAVICCRVSPKQKADVVHLVKNAHVLYGGTIPPATTLSIGDGANDVSMIMEAHVGVGIQGLEGLQAARSADFSIGQFRFLKHLLFKHGRLNYIRLSNLILISFWKNSVFTLTQILYGIYNGWSSQLLFEAWIQSAYNVFFSSGAIMVYALTEQDLPFKSAMDNPELYKVGTSNSLFNRKTFLIRSIGLSCIHAAILFYIAYFGWTGVDSSDGLSSGLWTFGSIIYTALVIVVNLKVILISSYITWALVGIAAFNIISFPLVNILYGSLALFNPTTTAGIRLLGVYTRLMGSPLFYILVFFSVIACLFPDYTYMAFQRRFYPSITDHVRFKSSQARQQVRDRAPLVNRIMNKLKELGIDNLSAPSARHRATGFAFSEPTDTSETIRKPQFQSAEPSDSAGPSLLVAS